VLKQDGNPFSACGQYQDAFDQYANEAGIPAIMMSAFAMQESSCQANAESSGTVGLFQLSPDKCNGVNCYDPTTNIKIAAQFIKTTLASYDNNVVKMMGYYNGWENGIKTSDLDGVPCGQQQNFNYPHQMLNGWMHGIDGNTIGSIKTCDMRKRKRFAYAPRGTLAPRRARKQGGWSF